MKNKEVLVSVIMGVYNLNNRLILETSINSILNQTHKKIEFIICDDGSTDGTYELIKNITKDENRVILIRNDKNYGLAFTLNKCLNTARGEYIARMDADDISHPDRIEKEVQFLETNREYALVGCMAYLCNEDGIWGKRSVIEKPEVKNMLFGSPFIHPTILVRKKIYQDLCGYRIANETIRTEDYDFFLRLYELGYKGYNLQEYLFIFREDNQSFKRKKYKYRIDEAKIRYLHFKKLNLLPLGYIFILKPLILGVIPVKIIKLLRREEII